MFSNISRSVLIETYWNVKCPESRHLRAHRTVLIETYWNVKKIGALVIFRQSHSINRNILECKVVYPFCLPEAAVLY